MSRSHEHVPHMLTKETPERICAVCVKPFELHQHYVELFRQESAHGGHALLFVHVTCAQQALETWIKRKEAKS